MNTNQQLSTYDTIDIDDIDDIEKNLKNIISNPDNIEDDTNDISTCSICLEENDLNSIELCSRCKKKFHSKCIDDLKRYKIYKCPACTNNLIDTKKQNKNSISYILNILINISFICFNCSIFSIIDILIFPSNLKYCDNIYKMCEYNSTVGVLYSNKINTNYGDFTVKYELKSSYQYTIESLNYTCVDLETHEYNSYNDVLIVSNKSLGTKKNIYYNVNNLNKCTLEYNWYNPFKYYLNCLTFIILFGNVILCSIPSMIYYMMNSTHRTTNNISRNE